MSNIAQAVVAAHAAAQALFFLFIQKSLEKGRVKKRFKEVSCDFFAAWGRVEDEGWFLSWADWKQQLMTWGDSHFSYLRCQSWGTLGSPQRSLSEVRGTPNWDCRDG